MAIILFNLAALVGIIIRTVLYFTVRIPNRILLSETVLI
jgi:hypothetical protein